LDCIPAREKEKANALMTRIIKEVQSFVRIIFFVTLRFYKMKINERDLKKDLLINMLSTLILKRKTY